MRINEFKDAVKDLGLDLSDAQMKAFEVYKDLLKEANEKINLTAISEDEEIYEKHFYDSLLSIKYFDYKGSLCDVGSGAGFPGLVLKIAYPELDVVLLEPIKKRCNFLEEVIKALDLKAVSVVNKRAEDYKEKREGFDIVTARAVKGLNILVELCAPLIKVKGNFVILKGSSGSEEVINAKDALKIMHLKEVRSVETELLNHDKRYIAIYEKVKATESKYPRNYSLIKRRPL